MTIKEIKKEFTVKNKRFIDVQNRVSFLNEQIERLSQYTPEAMVSLEEEYLVLKEKFDTLTPNENIEEALINE
jgi:aspartate carbamoyltransferase regulatory subunit